jgi:hypothetical protein
MAVSTEKRELDCADVDEMAVPDAAKFVERRGTGY